VDPRSKRIEFASITLHRHTNPLCVRKVEPRIRHSTMKFALATIAAFMASASAFAPSGFVGKQLSNVPKTSSSALEMKYKVAVVGGGPAGACAAEIFAQEKGIDTVLFERKMDNAKPCGGAIPLCMVGEFDLPESVVDRKVRYYVDNESNMTVFQLVLTYCSSPYTGSPHESHFTYRRRGLDWRYPKVR
jgi:hypothetical protein